MGIEATFRRARIAKVVERHNPAEQCVFLRDDHASVARGHVFVQLEAEDADIAIKTYRLSAKTRPGSLCTVFDQRDASLAANFGNAIDVAGCTTHMDKNYSASMGTNLLLKVAGIDAIRVVDVHQAGHCTRPHHGREATDPQIAGK